MANALAATTAWIFRGNIVVPTRNPFAAETLEDHAQSSLDDDTTENSVVWLGPGLKLLIDHELHVNEAGVITHLAPIAEEATVTVEAATIVQLGKHDFLSPGCIDLHIHAPQFVFTGTATDKPLMGPDGWLECYTFPTERGMNQDLDHCRSVMKACTETTLVNGTTTCVYFGSLDLEPCKILVDACLQSGQRALVGKPCMDRNAPDDYCQSTQQNLDETTDLISYIYQQAGKRQRGKNITAPLPRVLPLVTPRFIPTCSPALLSGLGRLAKEHDCHITSHLSESYDEVAFSKQLDIDDHGGDGRTDAIIFDEAGLLTDQCVMAHACHLTTDDMDLLKIRETGIVPCPYSNFFFAGNHVPCRAMLSRGNKVGLGTDVAGGPSPSMLDSQRIAVLASHSLQHSVLSQNAVRSADDKDSGSSRTPENHVIDYRHAFYMATLGGAEALGLDDHVGTFKVGMEFDAFILSADPPQPYCNNPNVHIFPSDAIGDILQKLLVLGDDRNITRVFVQGKEVVANLKSAP